MRVSNLFSRTAKENPKDAEIPSHRYLLRGGYMRQYTAGVYGLLPLAQRSILKIQEIIRQEMNRVGGQEVSMACMATAELWEESGRYQAIGKDMFRLNDRNDKRMVLNMTHEEPVVFLARTEVNSYKQLPVMAYQIQTKFRDEPRPRGGLIRLREFTMKDAYSFHTSEEDLQRYYQEVHEAYVRIFKRCGLKNFVSVLSDNGMFGGRYSHEFQLLVPTGEDKLITCKKCDYRANLEIASSPFHPQVSTEGALKKISTPGQKTIAELCTFLKVQPEQTVKAVMFQTKEKVPIFVFIRGDLEVVEQKLRAILMQEVVPATDEVIIAAGGMPGSTGPMGLKHDRCWVVVDQSALKTNNVVTGANEADFHYQHFSVQRDFLASLSDDQWKKVKTGDVAMARPGDPCPECSAELQESRGIEIGNIFHLGRKYSESMNCTYLDKEGKRQIPIMGCYGIGVTRLLPSVIEESHDNFGPVFPISIAPFELQICALNRKEKQVHDFSEELYKKCLAAGVSVILDDRDEKPGSQFADADLMGVPLRVTVSPKSLQQNKVEFKYRDGREPMALLDADSIFEEIQKRIKEEYARYEIH